MFKSTPTLATYAHVETDHRVFDASVAFVPGDKRFEDRRWLKPTVRMDDPEFVEWLRRNGEKDDEKGGGH